MLALTQPVRQAIDFGSFIDPFVDPSSTLHRLNTTSRPPEDHPKTKTRPPIEKYRFFIQNVDFSMEKCRFGAHRGVSHYVLRRERVMFRKNYNCELELCVKERGGRLALQNGRAREVRLTTPLTAFSRAIDRESHAGLSSSLKLSPINAD